MKLGSVPLKYNNIRTQRLIFIILLFITQRDESHEAKQEIRQEPQWQKTSLSGDGKLD